MDDADRAQKLTDINLNIALQKREQEIPVTGMCNWCEESIQEGRFCDSDCRDDFEKTKIMKG